MMADTTSPPAAFKALTACFLGTPVCCITMAMSFSSRLVSSSAPETLICYICKNSVSKCAVTCSLNVVMKCSQSLVLIAWRTTLPLQTDPGENDDTKLEQCWLYATTPYTEKAMSKEENEGQGQVNLHCLGHPLLKHHRCLHGTQTPAVQPRSTSIMRPGALRDLMWSAKWNFVEDCSHLRMLGYTCVYNWACEY